MCSVVANDIGVSVDSFVKPDSEGCLYPSGLSDGNNPPDYNNLNRDTCVSTLSLDVIESSVVPPHDGCDVPFLQGPQSVGCGREDGQDSHDVFSYYNDCEFLEDHGLGLEFMDSHSGEMR